MRLRQIEQFGVLFAAEILAAKQFLQADDLRALATPLRGSRLIAFCRLSSGSVEQVICTRPTLNLLSRFACGAL